MRARSLRLAVVAACTVVAVSGCVPWPIPVYVADASQGRLVHSTCALDHHLPDAIDVERGGVHAIVSLGPSIGKRHVETRYDVPPGRTLVLTSDRYRIDVRDGLPVREAIVPKVSKVDAPTSNYANPHVQSAMVPVGTPLAGGFSGPGTTSESWKHYWIAAPVDVDAAEIRVALPSATIDGVSAGFPEIRFERRLLMGVVVWNC